MALEPLLTASRGRPPGPFPALRESGDPLRPGGLRDAVSPRAVARGHPRLAGRLSGLGGHARAAAWPWVGGAPARRLRGVRPVPPANGAPGVRPVAREC